MTSGPRAGCSSRVTCPTPSLIPVVRAVQARRVGVRQQPDPGGERELLRRRPRGRDRRHPVHRRRRPGAGARERRDPGDGPAAERPTCTSSSAALGDRSSTSRRTSSPSSTTTSTSTVSFKDKALRQAFALCLPRQTIVDNLIKPDNPEAIVLDSRYYLPFQPDYEEVAARSLLRSTPTQNIEEAKKIRRGERRCRHRACASVTSCRTTVVRLRPSWSRTSCGPDGAGFNIIDEGDKTFFNADGALVTGHFDVAMFAWTGSPLVTGSSVDLRHRRWQQLRQLLQHGGRRADLRAEPDDRSRGAEGPHHPDRDHPLGRPGHHPGLRLPRHRGLRRHAEGVEYNATQSGLTWNMQDWNIS